jgi:hypothetical protein
VQHVWLTFHLCGEKVKNQNVEIKKTEFSVFLLIHIVFGFYLFFGLSLDVLRIENRIDN